MKTMTRRFCDYAATAGLAMAVIGMFVASPGCLSPEQYRAQADRAAYEIIDQAVKQTRDGPESFAMGTPAQTLRKRLLANQCLPVCAPASLGAEYITHVPHYPELGEDFRKAEPAALEDQTKQEALHLNLRNALQIAASYNRDYQSRKEEVFRSALALDLQKDQFRFTYAGLLEAVFDSDHAGRGTVRNASESAQGSIEKKLKTGASVASRIVFDLTQLLSQPERASRGILLDASMTIPLLAGAGRHIVTEPLTQAQRDVLYALWRFQRFRRSLAVEVADAYLGVLQQIDQVDNARENYRNLIASAQRARALADAGRMPEIQVDQARQDELRARDRWVQALRQLGQRTDQLKLLLGLPTDANVVPDRDELQELAQATKKKLPAPEVAQPKARRAQGENPDQIVLPDVIKPSLEGAGPLELPEAKAIRLALDNRLDLRTRIEQIADAQRKIVVAADALGAILDFSASGSAGARRTVGSARSEDVVLNIPEGAYQLRLRLDLPWERTAERNALRNRLIDLQQAVRDMQQLEDQVKLDIRNALRTLQQARESYAIQTVAVQVARRRVESTNLFLQAGRAEVRDVLEAQESLINAQNALTAALVNYRVAELQLQRDMGLLRVDQKGLWNEYQPDIQ
jgi:outer membrane protein TolC